MTRSLWLDEVQKPHFPALPGDCHTQVLIVGGGLTGILCAYQLQQAGVDYILLEADEIGQGITKNTTAKVTAQHGLIYSKIIRKYGLHAATLYYQANSQAVARYRKLAQQHPFHFENQDAYVYTLNNPQALHGEVAAYRKMGAPGSFQVDIPLPFDTQGAVKMPDQGQLHPLEFLYAMAQDLKIYAHTKVIHLASNFAKTGGGTVHFKQAIIATHFPVLNKHGAFALKMYQHRSYVLALEQARDVDGLYIDAQEQGLSFRNYGPYLLLGGGGHRTGKQGGNWQELEQFAKAYYPKAKLAYRWATQDCMTLDGLPYIGIYAKHTPNLFVATGYNKWGFTTAMVASEILRDLVQGKMNLYAPLFDPGRRVWHPQLAVNGFEAVWSLITPTRPRCPHMGCALKYNRVEHSWDCPCHGSRFTENGQLIDNPATDDTEI